MIAQPKLRIVSDLCIAMCNTLHGNDGIHPNRSARSVGIGVVPSALRVKIVAAVDVDNRIFVEVVIVQSICQQITTDWLQLRLRVDVNIVHVREHGGIGHTNNLNVVSMNHIVGHVVFRAHAVELQRILLGHKRNELGRIAVDGQQFLMGSGVGIIAETLHRIV